MIARKTLFVLIVVGAILAASGAWLVSEWRAINRTVADSGYEPNLRTPVFSGRPLLLFDEAHRNRHRLDGTYEPFARLATEAGLRVEPLREAPSSRNLGGAAALMIVTAQGPSDPGNQPAFSAQDIAAIREFVAGGGGLILVAEHFPFADAVQDLANSFGVEVSRGMIFDAEHADPSVNDESQIVFSRANGLLRAHPITEGQGGRKVESVVIFTGVSMSIPSGAATILATGPNATDLLPTVRVEEAGGDKRVVVNYTERRPAQDRALCVVLEYGKGRVVVLGEAGMLTAQYDRKTSQRYGLTSPGFDNEQFVVNLLRWLIPQK